MKLLSRQFPGPTLAHPNGLWGSYPSRLESPERGSVYQRYVQAAFQQLQGVQIGRRATLLHKQLCDCNGQKRSMQYFKLRAARMNPQAIDEALLEVAIKARELVGLQAFRSQLQAALVLIHGGFAELATGEGKSLATALAATVLAISGQPVHVMTANQYLARRDAEKFKVLFDSFGLTCSTTTEADSSDNQRKAFAAQITYTTARCVGFAYLRDQVQKASAPAAPPTLRGLCCALLDEADVILLDEARMPLVLSAAFEDAQHRLQVVHAVIAARALDRGKAFVHNPNEPYQREWTEEGLRQLESLGLEPWLTPGHRSQMIRLAHYALHDMHRDIDYVIENDKIEPIDTHSGRVARGRQWSKGLHEMLAVKEGLPLPKATRNIASIHYPTLLNRYFHLGGMSGTLMTERAEIRQQYERPVWLIPPQNPSKLKKEPTLMFADQSGLLTALADHLRKLQAEGRPTLVATNSPEQTNQIVSYLQSEGLNPQALHAGNESEEAQIIAQAGQPGKITVATQLAGRGTDIEIHPSALKRGGLAVISLQLNNSARTDRQVIGRAARQGQPGSAQIWLVETAVGPYLAQLPVTWQIIFAKALRLTRIFPLPSGLRGRIGYGVVKAAQRVVMREQRFERAIGQTNEQSMRQRLIFSR